MISVYALERPKTFSMFTAAREELQRDRLFPLLTPDQHHFYMERALSLGVIAAAPYLGETVSALAMRLGTTVEEDTRGDRIAGSTVYAEYDAASRRIRLHHAGIARLAARMRYKLSKEVALETARDLLIAHELFHHLEATQLGPVYRMLPPILVPLLGGLWTVKRPLRSIREIAAHGFAHTLLATYEFLP